MLALRYRQNAVFRALYHDPKGQVPVLRKDGSSRYVSWRGFMDLEEARENPKFKPVKVLAVEYSVSPGFGDRWRKLGERECIQGCLTRNGVYAVVEDGKPRIILR